VRSDETRIRRNKKSEKVGEPLSLLTSHFSLFQAVKLLPQPQPPVAFGLLKVKPEPCIELT
jgi:hypothetical protein